MVDEIPLREEDHGQPMVKEVDVENHHDVNDRLLTVEVKNQQKVGLSQILQHPTTKRRRKKRKPSKKRKKF